MDGHQKITFPFFACLSDHHLMYLFKICKIIFIGKLRGIGNWNSVSLPVGYLASFPYESNYKVFFDSVLGRVWTTKPSSV